MKKLSMAFVEGGKSGKLPGRPEARAVRNGEQDQLIFEKMVPPVKRNSKVYFLKVSSDEPNA